MALLSVTPYGKTLLRRQSKTINEIDDDIRKLVEDMGDTMEAAGGVGLAAPQVGVSKMLFLIDWTNILEEGGEKVAYINPQILEMGSRMEKTQEGCLSLPEIWADVKRPDSVKVKYMTLNGEEFEEELTGLPARVFQHEFDHLLGILFIDRISAVERFQLKDDLQAIMDGRIKAFSPDSITKEN